MNSKKVKSKVSKLIEKSDSENDENEHELSFYINDRVKLMKEVLKIIKPKKIKSMAPDCIKDLDIEEINSMLLEELLGISNKRLKYIFIGQNPAEDSSSTDPEEENKPIDIISLDDVSDDDFVIEVDSDKSKKRKHRIKQEKKDKTIKKEYQKKEGPLEENLMSVLELLELQARARAIRSQLMLEATKKATTSEDIKIEDNSDDDDVIIEVPQSEEIVINSSDSEGEQSEKTDKDEVGETGHQKKKIKLVRDRFDKEQPSESTIDSTVEKGEVSTGSPSKDTNEGGETNCDKNNSNVEQAECPNDDDEIILIVDQEEMDGIIGGD